MKKAVVWSLVAAGAVFLAVVVIDFATDGRGIASGSDDIRAANGIRSPEDADEPVEALDAEESAEAEEDGPEEESAEEEPLAEEERREAAEEKLVDGFDDLTDKWQEPSAKGVTMADIDGFAASFRKVPKARQDECVHRALNLIPDENVMLLVGIMMDKTMDKEIVETVYNDILNRDEDVKKPILQQIFKDKTHPCWADTAWILDATGELPKKD